MERLRCDGEQFLVLADFTAYARAQERVDALFREGDEWSRKSVINCLSMGSFSSDRSIREYADRIWSIKPVICMILMPEPCSIFNGLGPTPAASKALQSFSIAAMFCQRRSPMPATGVMRSSTY